MGNHKDLLIYKNAFQLAMVFFEVSKRFPIEERYSLTDQIRKCSRSVCANFAEAFRRRKYPSHFLSKLTDSDSENAEIEVWLDFSLACDYVNENEHYKLSAQKQEVGRLLGDIIRNPEKYK